MGHSGSKQTPTAGREEITRDVGDCCVEEDKLASGAEEAEEAAEAVAKRVRVEEAEKERWYLEACSKRLTPAELNEATKYHPWSPEMQKEKYAKYTAAMCRRIEEQSNSHLLIPTDIVKLIAPMCITPTFSHYKRPDAAEPIDHSSLVKISHHSPSDVYVKGPGADTTDIEQLTESLANLSLLDGLDTVLATRKNLTVEAMSVGRRSVALVRYGCEVKPDSGFRQQLVVRTTMRIYMAMLVIGHEYEYASSRGWPGWSRGCFGQCVVCWSDGFLPRWDREAERQRRKHSGWGVQHSKTHKRDEIMTIDVDMSPDVNSVTFTPLSSGEAIKAEGIDFPFFLGVALQDEEDSVAILSDRTF